MNAPILPDGYAWYIATVQHDNGTKKIKTVGTSSERVRGTICAVEGCPPSAVLSVTPL